MFSSCSHLSYLWQAGVGQLSLYNHERSVEEVLKDPRTPSHVREKLAWVSEIKTFVEKELGVKATSNYTTYVDLKKPYVVWSLTIAEPFELKIKEWEFPLVGSFPYLGFFKEEMAYAWEKKARFEGVEHPPEALAGDNVVSGSVERPPEALARDNVVSGSVERATRTLGAGEKVSGSKDTYVRGVAAYSTLGYLRDPLLSTMLTRKKSELVNLLFHETTHTQIYLKGYGSFNEQVASFIGDYGEKLWIKKNYGENSLELQIWEKDRQDRKRFGELLRDFGKVLSEHYKNTSEKPQAERIELKQAQFLVFHKKLEVEPWQNPNMFRYAKVILNNASLLAFLTYEDEQEVFDLLYERCGGSLKNSFDYLKKFQDEEFKPGIPPQKLLITQLRREAGRAICFDPNRK